MGVVSIKLTDSHGSHGREDVYLHFIIIVKSEVSTFPMAGIFLRGCEKAGVLFHCHRAYVPMLCTNDGIH